MDVDFLGGVRLNRQELLTGKPAYKDADANVSLEEVDLYRRMKLAEAETKRIEKEAMKAGNRGDKTAWDVADEKLRTAEEREKEARKKWDAERKKHEPPKVRNFRSSLLKCACVGQLFDPWYMYDNAQAEGKANRQETTNEKTHAHHLHITVRDRKIFIP